MRFSPRIVVASFGLAALVLNGPSASAQQSRKLGPEIAKAIQEATLDPTFQTTPIARIALVPLASTGNVKDAPVIVAKILVAQMAQLHPEYVVISPDELMNFVTTSKLDDQFNMFFGDYSTLRTVRQDFFTILKDKLKIDAVFVGTITSYGETNSRSGVGSVLGIGKKDLVVSLEMGLHRVSDGRKIWSGKDAILARKAEDLPRAAEAIGEVFARFVGRRAY